MKYEIINIILNLNNVLSINHVYFFIEITCYKCYDNYRGKINY